MSLKEKADELWGEVSQRLHNIDGTVESIRRNVGEKLVDNEAIIANLSDLLKRVEALEATTEAGGLPESLESQINAREYPSDRIIVCDSLQVIQDDRQTTPGPGTVYVIKEGVYGSLKLTRTGSQAEFSGEPGKPLVILAEPDKIVTLKSADKALRISGCHDVVIDGLSLVNEGNRGNGSGLHMDGKYQGPIKDVVIRNVSSSGWRWGCNGTGGDISDTLFEDCEFSNNPGEHGLYMGGREGFMQERLTFRGCTFNGNAAQGLYLNSNAKDCLIDHCSFLGNDDAIALFNGVCNTTIQDCYITAKDKGVIFYAYFQGIRAGIVPSDSTGNLIVNCKFETGGPSVYFNVQEAGAGFPIKMEAEIRDCTYNKPPEISDSKWLTADVKIV